jgi:hypothetical protein
MLEDLRDYGLIWQRKVNPVSTMELPELTRLRLLLVVSVPRD